MKKILLLILFISFAVSTAYCLTVVGPKSFRTETFGVSEGMSLKELTKKCKAGGEPKSLTNDDRYFFVPEKDDTMFKNHIAFIDKERGLYGFRFATKELNTTKEDLPSQLGDSFYDIVLNFSANKGFGRAKRKIGILKESPFPEDYIYYCYSCNSNAAIFTATWKKGEEHVNLPKDIEKATVYFILNQSSEFGYIILEYYYSNSVKVLNKKGKVLE